MYLIQVRWVLSKTYRVQNNIFKIKAIKSTAIESRVSFSIIVQAVFCIWIDTKLIEVSAFSLQSLLTIYFDAIIINILLHFITLLFWSFWKLSFIKITNKVFTITFKCTDSCQFIFFNIDYLKTLTQIAN